ncbi:hypothetical protein [Scytonema sp. NUACC21]
MWCRTEISCGAGICCGAEQKFLVVQAFVVVQKFLVVQAFVVVQKFLVVQAFVVVQNDK